VDPVLRAGIAHLWFVTIHPFEDGNGRIARAIADMALARADGSKDRFYSMSAQIESQRSEYYRRLETTQRGSLDITGWLLWFVECFEQSILGADGTIATVLYHARLWRLAETQPLSDRQRRVLTRLLDNFKGHLTTSKYAKLAGCSHDTALRDIQELLSRGLVVRNEGSGRSTSYRLVTDAELRSREPGGLGG
jgi:Fic family protein